jgi:hypothetical protein
VGTIELGFSEKASILFGKNSTRYAFYNKLIAYEGIKI